MRKRYTASGMVRIEAQLRPDEAAQVWQALGEMRHTARDGRHSDEANDTTADVSEERPVLAAKSLQKYVTAETSPTQPPVQAIDLKAEPSDAATKSQRNRATAETSADPDEDTPTPNLADGLTLLTAENEGAGGPIDHRTSLPVNYAPRFDLVDVVSSLLPNRGRL